MQRGKARRRRYKRNPIPKDREPWNSDVRLDMSAPVLAVNKAPHPAMSEWNSYTGISAAPKTQNLFALQAYAHDMRLRTAGGYSGELARSGSANLHSRGSSRRGSRKKMSRKKSMNSTVSIPRSTLRTQPSASGRLPRQLAPPAPRKVHAAFGSTVPEAPASDLLAKVPLRRDSQATMASMESSASMRPRSTPGRVRIHSNSWTATWKEQLEEHCKGRPKTPQQRFHGSRATVTVLPNHGVPLPTVPGQEEVTPSAQEYDTSKAWEKGIVSRAHSVPKFTIGVKLKSQREMEESLGHPVPPPAGATGEVSSFTADNEKQKRGVIMGERFKNEEEMMAALGYREGPAPGGSMPLHFMGDDSKRYGTGASFANSYSSPPKKPQPGKLGREGTYMAVHTMYPKETLCPDFADAPSFAAEDAKHNKGVAMLSSRQPLYKNIPLTPAPGGNVLVPSFVRENVENNRGVIMGGKVKSFEETRRSLGVPIPPGPSDYNTTKEPLLAGEASYSNNSSSRVQLLYSSPIT